ncbi:uncharacterized protein E0L32_008191 [Thyridium curvatum]|uniref:Autophagy-related protein 1 n=1 Tax=Thyridium curvatum TaxID=1093900 RepID=A0A507AM02_9PEZI|nr:uncharacterized protein E0L32_008191 [Thyridium curvatum]TPX10802.1 hypothetical protein E0L32_008191 [Thyridium curvatum]
MECLRQEFNDGVVLNGRYQTIAPLNHGSFGMVFMARDLRTTETVAIKCLTKKSAADDVGLDFAIDDKSEELVLHSRLGRHPNIVNLIDSFETDAHVYLVIEFCPRGDLYEAIRHGHGPLETEHVRRFMLELVDAVAYIHSKGIYHRDIKPENIFLTQSGSMKLGDFGLATTEKWTFETTVGSDRYMSPEQYDSAGAGYSPGQADIWAIGVCLLNILFSRNPFTTPTEADPLFLDFSRDKQSLFDVFPSMSQDTYEVIVECMNLDPTKRSLVGARRALNRVVSFTTSDEALDDFCSAERRTIASAHREPLRTPSLQSPQVDTGAFPWAKALQTSPQAVRQLSAIPDDESYTEELFPKSEQTTDWCSATGQTPLSSLVDSSLAGSMQSLNIARPKIQRSFAKVSPMAGSLPITMSKPRNQSAMSLVFGRKDTVSKSWSDMWDEDVEEEERTKQLQDFKEMNSRTWSQDSKLDEDDTPRQGLSPAPEASAINIPKVEKPLIERAIANNIDDDLVADGFFFHDAPETPQKQEQPRYSPPSKRSGVDKWAELGQKRRAFADSSPMAPKTPEVTLRTGRAIGSSLTSGFKSMGHGVWDHHASTPSHPPHSNYSFFGSSTANVHGNNYRWNASKDRVKECPWNKGRELNWRREKRLDFLGDAEWVGGWQEAHS